MTTGTLWLPPHTSTSTGQVRKHNSRQCVLERWAQHTPQVFLSHSLPSGPSRQVPLCPHLHQSAPHHLTLSKECMSCTPPSACAAPVRVSSQMSPRASISCAEATPRAPRSCSHPQMLSDRVRSLPYIWSVHMDVKVCLSWIVMRCVE